MTGDTTLTGTEATATLAQSTRTDDFETFTAGEAIADGANDWVVKSTTRDQEVVRLDDAHGNVFRMSSDPSLSDFAGPYSPSVALAAGESGSGAVMQAISASYAFRAVSDTADGSRLEVDFGNAGGTDRVNFLVLEWSQDTGLRIAVNEPTDPTDGDAWTTTDFTAFTGNRTLVEGLDSDGAAWHTLQMVLRYVDGADNDVVDVYLDGALIGTTTTFENYFDAVKGRDETTDHDQASRLFFRPSGSGAPADGTGGENRGFYFDDLRVTTFNDASLTGNALDNVLTGNIGDNALYGLAGDDALSGGDGDDVLSGGAGADTLSGGGGSDTLYGDGDDGVIDGGDGYDVLYVDSKSSLSGVTVTNVEEIVETNPVSSSSGGSSSGGSGDSGAGSDGDSGGGSDGGSGGGGVTTTSGSGTSATGQATVTKLLTNGASTTSTVSLVDGANAVNATLPAQVTASVESTGAATGKADAATDLTSLIAQTGSADAGSQQAMASSWASSLGDADTVNVVHLKLSAPSMPGDPITITDGGSSGAHQAFVIDASEVPAGTTIALNDIDFASVTGTVTINGGAGENWVVGDSGSQTMILGTGNDTVFGGGGNDTVASADGDDLLLGNQGLDLVTGGFGNDQLYGGQDADVVLGNQDDDTVFGNMANDTIFGGQGEDFMYGGQDNDVVVGNFGNDTLFGNRDDDTLFGGQDEDLLFGQQGADELNGNLGDDTLSGGSEDDRLIGGDGADHFVFGNADGNDTITDFSIDDRDSLDLVDGSVTSIVSDGAGNTIVTFDGGGTVTLLDVDPDLVTVNLTQDAFAPALF